MIRAVLFDYGGVLTPGGQAGCMQRSLAGIYGVPVSDFANDADLFGRGMLGNISEDDYYAELNRRHSTGQRLDHQVFLAAQDIFEKSHPVYDLAARLRSQGIATGILSNTNDIAALELERRGFYDGFSPLVLSYKEKMAKPQIAFYETALERLSCLPEEVVLVDDQEKCRPPAEELGMHFILATSPEQIVADVETLVQQQNGAAR